MTTTTRPAFAAGDVVTADRGTIRYDVVRVDLLDGGAARIAPCDRDDDRDFQWIGFARLTLVEPDEQLVGVVQGTHINNGYGFCRECRIAMTKAAGEPICDGTHFEVI